MSLTDPVDRIRQIKYNCGRQKAQQKRLVFRKMQNHGLAWAGEHAGEIARKLGTSVDQAAVREHGGEWTKWKK